MFKGELPATGESVESLWEKKAKEVNNYVDVLSPQEQQWVTNDREEGNLEKGVTELLTATDGAVDAYAKTYASIQGIFDRIRLRTSSASDEHWKTTMENFMVRVSAICIGEPPARTDKSPLSHGELPSEEMEASRHRGGHLMGS